MNFVAPGAGDQDEPDTRPGTSSFHTVSSRDRSGGEMYAPPYTGSYQNLTDGDFIYDMNRSSRGYALIINNQEFDKMDPRLGSEVDREAMYQLCLHMGFSEHDIALRNNLTVEEMKDEIDICADQSYADKDCLLVCILTHGDIKDIIYATNAMITTHDLLKPLKKSENLVGIPKMVFIQACRGTKLDSGKIFSDNNPSSAHKKAKTYKLAEESDFLYAHSTVPGYFSWRNQSKGSWFIQAVYDVFIKDVYRLDMLQLLTRVCRMVSYEFKSNASTAARTQKKQTPYIESTLTKELRLRKK